MSGNTHKIDHALSQKIYIASLLCTIMVVLRHSLNFMTFFGTNTHQGVCGSIESLFWMVTETAVPTFFLISGFFFFERNYNSIREYLLMLKKKTRTLLIPYLLWSILWAVPYYLTIGKEETVSIQGIFVNFFYSNFYGPLWYVRDLFFMMMLVPAYYWIFKLDKWYIYAIVLIALFFNWNALEMSVPNTVGLFMFPLGGILRRYSSVVSSCKNITVAVLSSMIWIILYSITLYGYSFHYRYNLMMVSGIIAFWAWLDYVPEKVNAVLIKIAPFSFFLYVTHYYIEKVVKVSVGKIFWGDEIAALMVYFILPMVLVLFLLFVGKIFKKRLPNLYAVMTGGR